MESEVFCIIVSMSDLELIALRMAPGSTAGSEQLTNATLDFTHNVRIVGYFMTVNEGIVETLFTYMFTSYMENPI